MPQPLYFQKHRLTVGGIGEEPRDEFMTTYGVEPRDERHRTCRRRISLKDDLDWGEVKNLQRIVREADFWTDFPEPGLRLIIAEAKVGDESQRIDLLYIRQDGGIFPCELKLVGDDKDTHGQLIRYLADLDNQTISKDWVLAQREKYLQRKYEGSPDRDQNVRIDLFKFEEAIEAIPPENFRLLYQTGIIMDEHFPSALITAVEFLNQKFGFQIRLIILEAYVEDDWTLNQEEYVMRLELNDFEREHR